MRISQMAGRVTFESHGSRPQSSCASTSDNQKWSSLFQEQLCVVPANVFKSAIGKFATIPQAIGLPLHLPSSFLNDDRYRNQHLDRDQDEVGSPYQSHRHARGASSWRVHQVQQRGRG